MGIAKNSSISSTYWLELLGFDHFDPFDHVDQFGHFAKTFVLLVLDVGNGGVINNDYA